MSIITAGGVVSMDAVDMVNAPPHYTRGEIEVADAIEGLGLENDHYLANAMEYIVRCRHKGNLVQDLEKAIWNLKRRITRAARVVLRGPEPELDVKDAIAGLGLEDDHLLASTIGHIMRFRYNGNLVPDLEEAIGYLERRIARGEKRRRAAQVNSGTDYRPNGAFVDPGDIGRRVGPLP